MREWVGGWVGVHVVEVCMYVTSVVSLYGRAICMYAPISKACVCVCV
jgi:hypothetical protein